jgi:hypothetical protein
MRRAFTFSGQFEAFEPNYYVLDGLPTNAVELLEPISQLPEQDTGASEE